MLNTDFEGIEPAKRKLHMHDKLHSTFLRAYFLNLKKTTFIIFWNRALQLFPCTYSYKCLKRTGINIKMFIFFSVDRTSDDALLYIYYSELNFRDVLLASAKLSSAVLSVDDCPEVKKKKLSDTKL